MFVKSPPQSMCPRSTVLPFAPRAPRVRFLVWNGQLTVGACIAPCKGEPEFQLWIAHSPAHRVCCGFGCTGRRASARTWLWWARIERESRKPCRAVLLFSHQTVGVRVDCVLQSDLLTLHEELHARHPRRMYKIVPGMPILWPGLLTPHANPKQKRERHP